MREIILGVGNPLLRDDSVGLRVVHEISAQLGDPTLTIEETCSGGLDILNIISDFDKAVIIDAVRTSGGRAGSIFCFGIDEIVLCPIQNAHRMDFISAIRLARQIGITIPQDIQVYAIEVGNLNEIDEHCTNNVEEAIKPCAKLIIDNYLMRHPCFNHLPK
jgi:hydrogenase maturation protease